MNNKRKMKKNKIKKKCVLGRGDRDLYFLINKKHNISFSHYKEEKLKSESRNKKEVGAGGSRL
jgi:hypothetical protein